MSFNLVDSKVLEIKARVYEPKAGDIFVQTFETLTSLEPNNINKIKNNVEIVDWTYVKSYWRIGKIRIYKPFSKKRAVKLMWIGENENN